MAILPGVTVLLASIFSKIHKYSTLIINLVYLFLRLFTYGWAIHYWPSLPWYLWSIFFLIFFFFLGKPYSDLKVFGNPSCNVDTYVGGLECCHHLVCTKPLSTFTFLFIFFSAGYFVGQGSKPLVLLIVYNNYKEKNSTG